MLLTSANAPKATALRRLAAFIGYLAFLWPAPAKAGICLTAVEATSNQFFCRFDARHRASNAV